MPERRNALIGCLVALVLFGVAATVAADLVLPDRYDVTLDGDPVYTVSPVDGRTWSAWAYRNGGEFDLAVSVQDRFGEWSDPTLLGQGDAMDQVEPALVVDRGGQLYLAWAERPQGSIRVAALRAGAEEWSAAIELTAPGEEGTAPALEIVGARLVVAWYSGAAAKIKHLPLGDAKLWDDASAIVDGPDPISVDKDKKK